MDKFYRETYLMIIFKWSYYYNKKIKKWAYYKTD